MSVVGGLSRKTDRKTESFGYKIIDDLVPIQGGARVGYPPPLTVCDTLSHKFKQCRTRYIF